MSIFDYIPETLAAHAVPLDDLGLAEVAWPRSVVEALLDALVHAPVAILGGDVLARIDGRLKHTYDNWYCNEVSGETFETFSHRCLERTREYIRRYPPGPDAIYYVVVIREAERPSRSAK